MTEQTDPCPWCRRDAIPSYNGRHLRAIACTNESTCGYRAPFQATEDLAAQLWNRIARAMKRDAVYRGTVEEQIRAHQHDLAGPASAEETIERQISSVELLTAMMTQAGDAAGRDLWRDGALVQIRQLAATVEGFKR